MQTVRVWDPQGMYLDKQMSLPAPTEWQIQVKG